VFAQAIVDSVYNQDGSVYVSLADIKLGDIEMYESIMDQAEVAARVACTNFPGAGAFAPPLPTQPPPSTTHPPDHTGEVLNETVSEDDALDLLLQLCDQVERPVGTSGKEYRQDVIAAFNAVLDPDLFDVLPHTHRLRLAKGILARMMILTGVLLRVQDAGKAHAWRRERGGGRGRGSRIKIVV
jgi:hypothetical protein